MFDKNDLTLFIPSIYEDEGTEIVIEARPPTEATGELKVAAKKWVTNYDELNRDESLHRQIVQANATRNIFHRPNRLAGDTTKTCRTYYVDQPYDESTQGNFDLHAYLPPSIVVNTKRSRQMYWLCTWPVSTSWWICVQLLLANVYGVGESILDPLLALRLPNFKNVSVRDDTYHFDPIAIEMFEPTRRYRVEDMIEVFEEPARSMKAPDLDMFQLLKYSDLYVPQGREIPPGLQAQVIETIGLSWLSATNSFEQFYEFLLSQNTIRCELPLTEVQVKEIATKIFVDRSGT